MWQDVLHFGCMTLLDNRAIYIAAGGKCLPVQLQRVRTSTGTIGVPDAASNCYLHKGRPFNICMHAQLHTATRLPKTENNIGAPSAPQKSTIESGIMELHVCVGIVTRC